MLGHLQYDQIQVPHIHKSGTWICTATPLQAACNIDGQNPQGNNRYLTHWDWETHICVGNLTIIDSDNGLLPGRHQAIIGTNVGILLIGTLGTNFSEIFIEMYIFYSRKCIWKCRPENGGHFVSASMC